jgi:uncharacterized damage-inducible protein DinB
MRTLVGRIFGHDRWATLALLDACASLTPAQLDDLTTPGTYGSIRATLEHMVGAHERYLAVLVTGGFPPRKPAGPPATIADLRERAERACDGLIAAASAGGGARVIEGVRNGEPFRLGAWVLLAQAIEHGTEHRTQVCAILGASGIPAPDLDVWAYDDAIAAE